MSGAVAAPAVGRVLFVDNFDSFTYNLVEYVGEVAGDADLRVVKNTASLDEVRAYDPDAILVSPGPGHPENPRDVGVTLDVLRAISPAVPTLGVCLGLEAAVYAYGGTVGHAPEPIHGKAFAVDHDGEGVFAGLEQGFQAGRYHSLVATEVPECFEVTATTDHDGTELVMGIRHREHPIECVQFHPESVLTAVGHDVIESFLRAVGRGSEPHQAQDVEDGDDDARHDQQLPGDLQDEPPDEDDDSQHDDDAQHLLERRPEQFVDDQG